MAKSGLGLDLESAAAVTVLKRAVQLDSESRYQQALICYQEGIDLLLQVLKDTAFFYKTLYQQKDYDSLKAQMMVSIF